MKKCRLARHYDRFMAPVEKAELSTRRRQLLESIEGGSLLEIGCGTGVNRPFYHESVKAYFSDPDEGMLRAGFPGNNAASQSSPCFCSMAEDLPFPDATFDTVVATLVLCSVNDPERVSGEIHRVLRPDGKLHFMEHIRGEGKHGIWQDRFQPLWSLVSCGCHPNRTSLDILQAARFGISHLETFDPFKSFPPWLRFCLQIVSPFISGVATKEPG